MEKLFIEGGFQQEGSNSSISVYSWRMTSIDNPSGRSEYGSNISQIVSSRV